MGFVKSSTILVGQSIENDLHALRVSVFDKPNISNRNIISQGIEIDDIRKPRVNSFV